MEDKQKKIADFFGMPIPQSASLTIGQPDTPNTPNTHNTPKRTSRKPPRQKGITTNAYSGSWIGILLATPFLLLSVYVIFIYNFHEEEEGMPMQEVDYLPVNNYVFSEGMALVESKESKESQEGKKYGYINEDYHLVIPLTYDIAAPFQSGRALVVKDGLMGYINRKGIAEIPIIYSRIYGYSERLYCVQHKNKGWGYIDWDNNIIIPFGYPKALPFSEGLGAVENTFGSWGFVNHQNQMQIPFQYEEAMPFHGGLAAVKKDGKWGFITKSNRLAVPAIYDEIFDNNFLSNGGGKAKVRVKENFFYIDSKGKRLP